jgi:cyclic pyranopterin phosphate synthase
MVLRDKCGRPLLNLRVAITRKCNLRCTYCHKEGQDKDDAVVLEEMSPMEIARIVEVSINLGASRIKLTGGEPLTRKDIVEIIERINAIPGLTDLSLTTNGTLLASLAPQLHAKGLKRVNISLPTLDEKKYTKLTGGTISDALEGVKAAIISGFEPVKLNVLMLKGINDDSVPEMIEFARKTGTILQLIELEPVNVTREYYLKHHVPLDTYEARLEHQAVRVETRRYMQNRHIYYLPKAIVEVVRPIENTDFCLNCTRLRVTSDGKLKPCLMRNDNLIDMLTPLRQGASDHELMKLFMRANDDRRPFQTAYVLQD